MIVNFQDFYSVIEKISNSLGSFDEVMFPYRASTEKNNNSSFRLAKPDKNKNPELNYPSTIDPLKILFDHSCEKVYPLKDHNAKRIMLGIIADTKKSMKSFFRNNFKRDSEIITEFL